MADGIFNIARGRDIQFAHNVNDNTPGTAVLTLLLLTAAEADDTLNNYTTLGALLGAAGNTEATATNYTRKTLTDADGVAITVNNTANTANLDIPNQVFTSLGGATNNTFVKAIIAYNETGGADSGITPMYHFDISAPNDTTNGQNFTVEINASGLMTNQG